MTTLTAQDVLQLYGAQGFDNAVLTDHDDQIFVVARLDARHSGWPVLAYQIDLSEEYPEGMTPEQAQAVADRINEARAEELAATAKPAEAPDA